MKSIGEQILEIVARHMNRPAADILWDDSLFEQGVGSLMAVEIVADLEAKLDCVIEVSALWEFETIAALSEFLESEINTKR